jgi:hypothetical protein
LETLQKLVNKNLNFKPAEINFFSYNSGAYKLFESLGPGWIVKMLKPEKFPSENPEVSPTGSDKWALDLKNRIESHLQFVKDFIGDVLEKSRIVVGDSKDEHDGTITKAVYKIQKDRSEEIKKLEGSYYEVQSGKNVAWFKLINQPEHKELKEDFRKLYFGWKMLRSYGLSFDIYPDGNLVYIEDGVGKLRLKVFDVIPLFLIDSQKFSKSWIRGVPKDLVILDSTYAGGGYEDSESFFKDLQPIFEPTKK